MDTLNFELKLKLLITCPVSSVEALELLGTRVDFVPGQRRFGVRD